MNKSSTRPVNRLMGEWKSTNWRKLERYVFKLQKDIYKAASQGNVKLVRKLQRLLMRSWSNKMLAVRRVTQDNRGKNTAGVDGVKSLSPAARMKLARTLKITGKSQPTRRVWIPKPGKTEKRPLGIPTMYDRALQGVVKAALEPEWEAKFEPNSYGFRPGRSCQDAITQIKYCLQHKAKFVLDADISKCFDKINHKKLLEKLNIRGKTRRQIESWLTSGVIDKGTLAETTEGTPQGGVISPLLANIALHGMEEIITRHFPADRGGRIRKSTRKYGYTAALPNVVRYADDFVVMSDNLTVLQECKQLIAEWLEGIGLELRPEKTRLTHTLNPELSEDGKAGFDFLGFHIQQYPCSKYKGNENTHGRQLGWELLITPAKDKVLHHQRQLSETVKRGQHWNQANLITKLNPIITGWTNYLRYSDIKTVGELRKQDHLMYEMLRSWGRKKTGSVNDAHNRYWMTVGNRNWVFAARTGDGGPGAKLALHSDTECSSTSYVKVKGTASPFNGDDVYWAARLGTHPELPRRVALLLKQQKGKCRHCESYFRDGEVMEVDHKIPRAAGGKDYWDNLQLLHGHCHDSKSIGDQVFIDEYKESIGKVKADKRKAKKTKKRDYDLSMENDAQLTLEEELNKELLYAKS